ncbi:YidC/Oxa1 family membrane protein insertase [Geodermatophilus pulveris]|uniref:Membrane protein insertase YidC n=1 Tax=Geodermatophilus pulveris TaxID=1564159 RepID=A0A239FPI6_9ACTN|nr:membrane protein insertase YidC [Geodermatophilus pulveris]SNS58103.1 YidC/Oxa1 family membrane protein insertase [Geodermatophilus pulveris]
MLDWLYTAISWVMAQWHSLWSLVFDDPEAGTGLSGLAWALSIVFLVVTVRLILFPLFVKQVKSQRAMQELQPDIQRLRTQYGSDRQGFAVAMQKLQKERNVNPLAGCLPILPQIPIFLSLFHVLRRLSPEAQGLYSWSTELTREAAVAPFFGAPISSSFFMTGPKATAILDVASYTNIRVVGFLLILVMSLTTYVTQRQIMSRSGPVEGQAAMVQKLLLYVMPMSLFVSGFFFPIGVLLYWFTNNLWTLGQQFFILRKMPPPGSPAAKAKAAADKPAVDPKTLAPKPGAKPVRPRTGRTAAPASTVEPAPTGDATVGPDGNGTPTNGTPTNGTPTNGTPPADTPTPTGATAAGAHAHPPAARSANGRARGTAGRGSPGPANRGKRKRR